MIKLHDAVRCIKESDYGFYGTLGSVYTVVYAENTDTGTDWGRIDLRDSEGVVHTGIDPRRFEVAEHRGGTLLRGDVVECIKDSNFEGNADGVGKHYTIERAGNGLVFVGYERLGANNVDRFKLVKPIVPADYGVKAQEPEEPLAPAEPEPKIKPKFEALIFAKGEKCYFVHLGELSGITEGRFHNENFDIQYDAVYDEPDMWSGHIRLRQWEGVTSWDCKSESGARDMAVRVQLAFKAWALNGFKPNEPLPPVPVESGVSILGLDNFYAS